MIPKAEPVQGVARAFGIIGAEPPQTGDWPLLSSDTGEVGVLPPGGGGGKEVMAPGAELPWRESL